MGFYFDGSGQRTHRYEPDDLDREDVKPLRPSPGKSSRTHGGGDVLGIPGKISLTARLAQRIDRHARYGRSKTPEDCAREMVAQALGSTGQPLPDPVRRSLEEHADTSLADVHVHTGPESVRAADALGAEAFTVGRDIHFAAGVYDPDSADGRRLLAHEVAHAIQQRSLPRVELERAAISQPDQAHERYADEFAGLFTRAETELRDAESDWPESLGGESEQRRKGTGVAARNPQSGRGTRSGDPRGDEPDQPAAHAAARAASLEVARDTSSDWLQALQRDRSNAAGDVKLPAGTGQPLSPAVRARMEAAFGHDFSHVRIHTDSASEDAVRRMKAHAVAQGSHVYFGRGEFAPGTPNGDRLLLHELTHVVQADEGRLPSRGGLSSPDDSHEREAYAAESRMASALGRSDAGQVTPPISSPSRSSDPISAQVVSRDGDASAPSTTTPSKTGPTTTEDALLGDLPNAADAPPASALQAQEPRSAPAPVPPVSQPEPQLETEAAPAAANVPAPLSAPPSGPGMREAPAGPPPPVLAVAPPQNLTLASPSEWAARARQEGARQSVKVLEAASNAALQVRTTAGAETARASAAFAAARARLEADAATARTEIQARVETAKAAIESSLTTLSGQLDADFVAREQAARDAVEVARTRLSDGIEAEAQRALTESDARAQRALELADLEGNGGDEPLAAGQRDIARRVANEVATQCSRTGVDAAAEVRKAGALQLSGVDNHLDGVLTSLAQARASASGKLDSMRSASLSSLDEKAVEANAEIDTRTAEASAALSSRESELTGWLTSQAETEAAAIEAKAAELTGSIDPSFAALAAAYDQCQAELDAAVAEAPDATPEILADVNAGVVGELERMWQESAAPQIAQTEQAIAALTSHGASVADGFAAAVTEAETSSSEGAAEQGSQVLSVGARFSEACAAAEAQAASAAQQGVAGELAEADRAVAMHQVDIDAAVTEALGSLAAAVDSQLAWEDQQLATASERITTGQATAASDYESAKSEAKARDQGEQTTSRGWLGDLWNFFDDLAQRTLEWFQEKLGRIWGNIIGWILAGIIYLVGVVVCAAAWLGAQVINLIWGFIWGETAIPGYGGGVFAFIADVFAGVIVLGDIRDVFKYWIWRPLWGEGPWWLNLLMGAVALLGLIPVVGDGLKAIIKALKAGSKTALKWLAKLVGEELAERIARALGEEVAERIARRLASEIGEEAAAKLIREIGAEAAEELLEQLGKDVLQKLAQDLSGATIQRLVNEIGERAIKKLAEELSGTAIERIAGDLGKDAIEKLLRTVGGATIEELHTHLGKDALVKLLDGLRGVTVKEYFDALGGPALRNLAKDLDGYAVKELMDSLGAPTLRKLATDLDGAVVQRLATDLGAPALRELAEKLAPTMIRDLVDTLGKDLVLRFKTSLGVDGLKQITDAITPAQFKAFVDEIGEQGIEDFGAKALAEVGRHLNPTELMNLLTSPNTTMRFLRSLCEEAGAGAALKTAAGHFGSFANLGQVLAKAEGRSVPAAGLREFLQQCPTNGWRKLAEIDEFFKYAATSGAAWGDLIRWAETLGRNTLGNTTKVAGRTAADPSAAYFRDLVDVAGNTVRITFNSADAAHVASRHTWERFAVTPGNADLANSMLPDTIRAVDVEAIGARLLQNPRVAGLVSTLAPGTSNVVQVVDGAITYEVRVTLQNGINGMTTFYPVVGAGVETLSKDAMRAIIWLWKSI